MTTPRVEQYTIEAAERFQVTPAEILGDSRKHSLMPPRREIWRRLRADGFSYPQIGAWTNRHHTTVLHGLRQLERSAVLR